MVQGDIFMDYAVLVVNGNIDDITYYEDILSNAKVVVCADGGSNLLYKYKIHTDFIIGDLDSIREDTLSYYKSQNVVVHKYPVKKNKTDSEISIDIIKSLGMNKIFMIGAIGNRIDHLLTNINLLYYADKLNIYMSILDENNEIILLNKKENFIDSYLGQTISFVSISGDVCGISLKGFEYELQNYDLSHDSSILTSNVAKSEKVFVSIEKGSLLCIKVNE
ncbi:thiamine diphosphokinase [Peptoanaerobacter stomatis]|uniref:Thiamine diphosphokinase n=2 Tax=Peptoanaerobacter stomatis TaxID=796937 RepID=J6HAP7_9FIRM|nr:thiamine diphosphokinase [Peptoanaerobacter stomatis]NWO25002.1 thiamine diphosphokinase [Peptostreptococcaceae bacterium oral taxon 081]